MIPVSIVIEGQQGLNWPRWKRIVETVDESGFAGLFRSDHFTDPQPPDRDSLELVVSLTYLADHSRHVHFGPLVAPVSFRDPVMLARQAIALDNLSGGRMILGLGAGWQEREHAMFGYDLGSMHTRMDRLKEALEVVTQLLRSDEPVSYEGRSYRLHDAVLLPRPERAGGPPILIGGSGPKRTLPLVARYADIWNSLRMSPSDFRERSLLLDDLLQQRGRRPEDVKRSLFTGVFYAYDEQDLPNVLDRVRAIRKEYAGQPDDELFRTLRASNIIVGTGEMIRGQIEEFEKAGVEEIMLRWTELDDMDRLRAMARNLVGEGTTQDDMRAEVGSRPTGAGG